MGKEEKKLKDSGEKREFSTGAHRDSSTGKGRMDLLPADIVNRLLDLACAMPVLIMKSSCREALRHGFSYMATKQRDSLESAAIYAVCACGEAEEIVEGYDPKTTDDTVAERFTAGLIAVSKHYEAGAAKYGENNWKKGMPVSVFLDSALRHNCKAAIGIDDEPHERAAAWNYLNALYMMDHNPDMCDMDSIGKPKDEVE